MEKLNTSTNQLDARVQMFGDQAMKRGDQLRREVGTADMPTGRGGGRGSAELWGRPLSAPSVSSWESPTCDHSSTKCRHDCSHTASPQKGNAD